jgi:hypothetical protein
MDLTISPLAARRRPALEDRSATPEPRTGAVACTGALARASATGRVRATGRPVTRLVQGECDSREDGPVVGHDTLRAG